MLLYVCVRGFTIKLHIGICKLKNYFQDLVKEVSFCHKLRSYDPNLVDLRYVKLILLN